MRSGKTALSFLNYLHNRCANFVDHARQHQAAKRGGSAQQRLSITSAEGLVKQPEIDLLALNEALEELRKMDPQQERIVELKFFGGLSIEETAEVLVLVTRRLSGIGRWREHGYAANSNRSFEGFQGNLRVSCRHKFTLRTACNDPGTLATG